MNTFQFVAVTRTTELQLMHPDFPTVFGSISDLFHLINSLPRNERCLWARTDTGWRLLSDELEVDVLLQEHWSATQGDDAEHYEDEAFSREEEEDEEDIEPCPICEDTGHILDMADEDLFGEPCTECGASRSPEPSPLYKGVSDEEVDEWHAYLDSQFLSAKGTHPPA